ncbi:uncharacterized protein MYCGRDRAFT_80707 [Zymoseptoria tritici IPO323]|uniref:Uncharacterized protein n=1 Tax=Zymoseptoria tritici (strain CBS 115943 / IPO323) TaxID=336722 RepID=F9XB78_ZYMTI|nr:uncharacterized protein MYCGRDRAFT_80707 [Zymoseptoria tritici IPO323]EGP87695.1 hypothetical protein MYCGRDRAFT_80707 [Zymoseptoria tritici IPO323]
MHSNPDRSWADVVSWESIWKCAATAMMDASLTQSVASSPIHFRLLSDRSSSSKSVRETVPCSCQSLSAKDLLEKSSCLRESDSSRLRSLDPEKSPLPCHGHHSAMSQPSKESVVDSSPHSTSQL